MSATGDGSSSSGSSSGSDSDMEGGDPALAWRLCMPEEGPKYYFNIVTGETVWQIPPNIDPATIKEFGVEDEVYDPNNDGSSGGSGGSSGSDSDSSDHEGDADDDVGAGDATVGDAAASDGDAPRAAPASEGVANVGAAAATTEGVASGGAGGAGAGAGASVAAIDSAVGSGRADMKPSKPTIVKQQQQNDGSDHDDGDGDEEASSGGVDEVWALPPGITMATVRMEAFVPKWEKRLDTMSGDVYYIHTETEETAWEQPDDYTDPDDLGFDEDEPLDSVLASLGLWWDADGVGELLAERDAIRSGGADITFLHGRLVKLLKLLQAFGTEQEWTDAIAEHNMWLPHFVFTCWSPATPDETCFVVAQLLVLFGNLAPGMSVTKRMIDGAWGTLGECVGGAAAGLQRVTKSHEQVSDSTTRCTAWLLLLQSFYAVTHEVCEVAASGGDVDDDFEEPPREDVGGQKLASLFVSVAATIGDDDVRLCVAMTAARMFALDELLRRGGRDVWGPALAQQTGSRQLSQALISLLNTLSFPYADPRGVVATLALIKFMFGVKLTARDDSAVGTSLFFTNDIRVLVDVLIREITDLPPSRVERAQFIGVLGSLMLKTQWGTDGGLYRAADIASSLELLVDEDERPEDLCEGAVEAATEVLAACSPLLDA